MAGTLELLASTLANPAEWLRNALGGTKSTSGVRVNYRSALTIAYVYAAQQIISGDVASLPFDFKRREADDDLILDREHPGYWLLNGDSNDEMSAYLFRETLTHWALLFGNGMAYILRDAMGRPVQLIPACPGDLSIHIEGGKRLYHNSLLDETFDQSAILHIRGLGDELGGHPLLQLAKNSFGLSLIMDKHGSEAWKNGAGPKVILKHAKTLNAEQANELLERFEARHSEPGKPALAAGGLDIEVVPSTNSDAQWNESRRQIITEVAAWYNLPPHKLGDNTRVGYNGVTAENQAYITQTLRRWLKRWETEVARKLLVDRDYRSMSVVVSHDPKPLTDTDTAAITDEVVKQIMSELITPNEGRRRLGYPLIEGGDVRQNPNTSSPEDPEDDDDEQEEEPEAMVNRAPFVNMFEDRLKHLKAAMTSQAESKRKKDQTFDAEWTTTWTSRVESYIQPQLLATATVFETASMDTVTATVSDWCIAASHGEVLVPSPAELANQIVGEMR